MNQYVYNNLSVPFKTYNGVEYRLTYQQLCLKWDTACYDNNHILFLSNKDHIKNDPEVADNEKTKLFIEEIVFQEVS